ncbi:MAG: hypothetical protein Q9185_000787 [Variospora sp. 1 TL-2023]
MPKAVKGVLVECDPSIKAIILKIDQERHDYIVEDLDDQTLVIKESQLPGLKERLDKVCTQIEVGRPQPLIGLPRSSSILSKCLKRADPTEPGLCWQKEIPGEDLAIAAEAGSVPVLWGPTITRYFGSSGQFF